jgi:dipeptidyl aminopeptidase/acylaminoacyl peptidase
VFAAAAEASGVSDIVSHYAGLWGPNSAMQFYERSQGRMASTLWQQPGAFIENSPIFSADKVTTPLLMMSNKKDDGVPFTQGIELFTALRRLGKRVWMLQYDDGDHTVNGKDALDLQTRTFQFFDHYLRGAPPPRWMTEGIPARLKGIDAGLELDTSGRAP